MLLLSFYLINFFFHENYFYFFMFRDVPGCSGMFRHVPECSMFRLLSTPYMYYLFRSQIMAVLSQLPLTTILKAWHSSMQLMESLCPWSRTLEPRTSMPASWKTKDRTDSHAFFSTRRPNIAGRNICRCARTSACDVAAHSCEMQSQAQALTLRLYAEKICTPDECSLVLAFSSPVWTSRNERLRCIRCWHSSSRHWTIDLPLLSGCTWREALTGCRLMYQLKENYNHQLQHSR